MNYPTSLIISTVILLTLNGVSYATDTDGDGISDPFDNCTTVVNPAQVDTDGDGFGNYCDSDFDQSGSTLGTDWLALNAAMGSALALYDLNSSGSVNGADYLMLLGQYATAPGPSGLACADFALASPPAAPCLADGVDMGDLTPPGVVPQWGNLDHLPVYDAAQVTVSVSCAAGAAGITAAQADNTVVQLAANCEYVIPAFGLRLDGVGRILRGVDETTVLTFTNNRGAGVVFGCNSGTCSGWEQARDFAAGQAPVLNDRVLTLVNTTGLSVGSWVRVSADIPANWHSSAQNAHVGQLTCVGIVGDDFCALLAPNQVKLDRGVLYKDGTTNHQLEVHGPNYTTHSGLESLTIRHQTPDELFAYFGRAQFNPDAFENWVVDVNFEYGGNQQIDMQGSRNLIRGSTFPITEWKVNYGCDPILPTCNWNKGTIYFQTGSSGNVFEYNIILNSEVGPNHNGGSGNIVAYTWIAVEALVEPERCIFMHGRGTFASLTEGNECDAMINWDSTNLGMDQTWIVYNQLNGQDGDVHDGSFERGLLGPEGTGNDTHRNTTIIGNYANRFDSNAPPFEGVDTTNVLMGHENTYVAYNTARTGFAYNAAAVNTTGQATNNVGTTFAPAAMPPSFYRKGTPSWWCTQSGPYGGHPLLRGTLPAEIRHNNGVCTAP